MSKPAPNNWLERGIIEDFKRLRKLRKEQPQKTSVTESLKQDYTDWLCLWTGLHGKLMKEQREVAWSLIEYLVNCQAAREGKR